MKIYSFLLFLFMTHSAFSYDLTILTADPSENLSLGLETLDYQKGKDISHQLIPKELYTLSYIEAGVVHSKTVLGRDVMAFIQEIEGKGGEIASINH